MEDREGRVKDWLRKRAPALHRFMTREDRPWPLIREATLIGGVLLILAVALWGGTGQSFPDAPVVVVESGSMMHCANGVGPLKDRCAYERYGRFGTIDPGDLIFVKDADKPSDVTTLADGGKKHHGMSGDVIVFRPNGIEGTPIIHRAMFWLEVHGDGSYSIPELGIEQTEDLSISALGIDRDAYRLGSGCSHVAQGDHASMPVQSGFITKGDNNQCFDQEQNHFQPVRMAWVMGKARGEIPWLGVIKLQVSDWFGPSDNVDRYVPRDISTMMWLTLGVLVGAPFAIESVHRMRERAREDEPDEKE